MTAALETLRTVSVPTLANAIEVFGIVPSNRGYTTRPLTCHFPDLGTMIGYAVTVTASTDQPPGVAPAPIDEPAYWRWTEAQPGPKVVVVQDLDDPPGGAMWGEWNAHVHQALGCVGCLTHGAVRDLDALERLGFHTFATSVSVAHGYGAWVGYGEPVSVAGLTVRTGDLVVADRHGALSIPSSIDLGELVDVARAVDRLEAEVFACCRAPDFSIERLEAVQASVLARWPKAARERTL
jgi:regulator of RNase E activity RraA